MIDTEALRKKILKSAVTGKISKQLDSDTPVSSDLKEYIPTQLDIDLDDIPDTWKYCKFDEVIINRDSESIPVSVADRKKLDKEYILNQSPAVIDEVNKICKEMGHGITLESLLDDSDGKLRTCFNLYSLHNWMKNFNYEGNDFFKEDLW